MKRPSLTTSWSFSKYETYEQCPLRYKLKYIDRLKEPSSPVLDRGTAIHKIGENYILAPKKPAKVPVEYVNFTEELAHLREGETYVEQEWGFKRDWQWNGRSDWFGADTWLRGKADAAKVYDDATMLLVDWKTGKKYDKNELQVQMFSILGMSRFPQVTEVDTRLWYLDAAPGDNEIQATYYRKDMPALVKDWERRIKPMFADARFPPRANAKCRWCHFRNKASGGVGLCKF